VEHVGASHEGARLPAWAGPPDHVMPGAVPTEALLAASSKAVVWISIIWAYPAGFQLELGLRIRKPQAHGNWASVPLFPGEVNPETGALELKPAERFYFALSFSDGRTVDNPLCPILGRQFRPSSISPEAQPSRSNHCRARDRASSPSSIGPPEGRDFAET
jgi:hypothetical protein